jgi:hypothetical protein
VPVEVLGLSVVMKAVAMLIAVPPQMLRWLLFSKWSPRS